MTIHIVYSDVIQERMLCRALRFEHGEPVLFSKRESPCHALAIRRSDGQRSVSTIGKNWNTTVSLDDKFTHVHEHHADILYNPDDDSHALVPRHETRVNGVRISATTKLQNGDVIAFGSVPEGYTNECQFVFRTKETHATPFAKKRIARTTEPTLFVGVPESVSKRMVDELTCYVCYDIVENPCVVSCGHMGCEECLTQLVQCSETGVASCGLCRAPFEMSNINPCIGLRHIVKDVLHHQSINVTT